MNVASERPDMIQDPHRLLRYLLTAASPSLELTVNTRPLYGHRYTKLWCIFHVSLLPSLKHLYSRPYLHEKNLAAKFSWGNDSFCFTPQSHQRHQFSDWLLTSWHSATATTVLLRSWKTFLRSWELRRGNLTWEITQKHFQETEVLIVRRDVKTLNYSSRKF